MAKSTSPAVPLRRAIECAHQGFLLIDKAGRVACANAQMADFLPGLAAMLQPGAGMARLIGAAIARVLVVDARKDARRRLRARLLAVGCAAAEVQLHDGRWISISGSSTDDGGMLAICADITVSHHLAERGLAALADRDFVLENLVRGICLYAPDATVRLANSRYAEVLGVDPALVRPGVTMRALLAASIAAGHHGERSLNALEHACLVMVERRQRQRIVLTLGTGRLVSFDHIPVADGGWLATFEDITEQRQVEDRAAFLSRHDALTSLPNRVVLGERLEQAMAEVRGGMKFALMCVNLDHFKTINDAFGLGVGDRLLRAVGERLAACAGHTNLVCRLGADEFAILQCGITRVSQCAALAQRLTQELSAPFEVGEHAITLSASIGIAIGPDDAAGGELLRKQADAAMGVAKRDGGGVYRLFDREMDAHLQARRAMDEDLRNALAVHAFELHYQPLVDVASGRVTGFEALLRWRNSSGVMVQPAEFIPLAEETGLIVPIGEWVLREACIAACGWPAPLRVAVNVSPVQVKDRSLAAHVAAALGACGLSPPRLELEITESVLLGENAATLDVLRGLRAQGVHISMDDFGTGYSSLSYLRSFPFDKIKIDQSFVRDLDESVDSAAIVCAIIGLGRGLGMRVTAEGVETAGQMAWLRAQGCDEVQGYLFSRPRPAQDVPDMLARIDRAAMAQ